MDYFVKTANEGKPFNDAFIFDCHGHFGEFNGFYIPNTSAEKIVEVLDKVGINKVAISTFADGLPFGNEIVANQAVSSHPDRFIGYSRVNGNYPEIMRDELTRCFDEFGFKGIKLHPYCDQVLPSAQGYRPAWEFANERNCSVLIHTWGSLRYSDPLLEFCFPSKFEQIAKDYPDANLILGHSGGEYDGVLEAIEVAKAFPNVYLDTASSRLYPGVIEMMVKEVGADKVLYGSDIPFLSAVPQIGKVVNANISEEDKRKILGLNTAKLFGLERPTMQIYSSRIKTD